MSDKAYFNLSGYINKPNSRYWNGSNPMQVHKRPLYTKMVSRVKGALLLVLKVKEKAIPATGRGGPYGCEMSRLPHFPDNQLTDCGEAVNLTHRPPFTPGKISGTHFC
jgi:hypothetical protein